MKKVAIVGSQGVPAMYGGFETLVENIIGENCSKDIQYTVFCSSKDNKSQIVLYKNARLVYIPFHANGMESVLYDIVSMIKTIGKFDAVVALGVSGCIFLPIYRLLFRGRVIVNIDGLEHKRAKWGKIANSFLRLSEFMAVRFASAIIADNKGIQDYVKETYKKDSVLIAYGGDHVITNIKEDREKEILDHYKLTSKTYSLAIGRIEPENNCHMILEGFARNKRKLVFVGNWQRSEYSRNLEAKYSQYDNILIVQSIYNIEVLYAFRNNCRSYLHGHSAGGTNPSLVEAMFFGMPILSFDVVYNRETTENKALYFTDENSLSSLVDTLTDSDCEKVGQNMKCIAEKRYTWAEIARQYELLY